MSSPDRSYNNRLAPLVGFLNHLFKYWPHTHFCYMMIFKKLHEWHFFRFIWYSCRIHPFYWLRSTKHNCDLLSNTKSEYVSGVKSTSYDNENLTYEYHYLFRLHSKEVPLNSYSIFCVIYRVNNFISRCTLLIRH